MYHKPNNSLRKIENFSASMRMKGKTVTHNTSKYSSVKNIMICLLFFLVSCMSIASYANTLSFKSDAPIEIESDHVVFDQNTGELTYQGNVIVISGTQKLYANKVILKKDNQKGIQSIQATGTPAHFINLLKDEVTPIHAYASQIDYDPNLALLTLTGQAKIVHQTDTFEGPLLRYIIEDQKIEAIYSNNQRPKMTITPQG